MMARVPQRANEQTLEVDELRPDFQVHPEMPQLAMMKG
jgi:hypothetical protein